MRIGLSYDLRESVSLVAGCPEDTLEEYDCRETVDIIAGAIEGNGHQVVRLGGGREFLVNVLREKTDLVFNISEGRGNWRSREAQVPSVLEMLNAPYSGADPQCLAVCLDKPLTKKILAASGVRTPRWRVVGHVGELRQAEMEDFPFPAFVKPAHEGSSKGVRAGSRVEDFVQLESLAGKLLEEYGQPVMIEEFISGDEVTVGIVGNSPPAVLGIMRILPRVAEPYFVYSLEVKRDWEALVDYECPAHLDPPILREIEETSLKVFDLLGCRDFARLDYRLDSKGSPHFLEINPLPGLGTYSDLVIMALKLGWSHEGVISAVLNAALERYPQCVPA